MRIIAVYISTVAWLVTGQLENHPFISCLSGNMEQSLTELVLIVDASAQLDMRKEIGEHISVVVVRCVEEAVSLFRFSAEPLLNESFMVVTGQLLAMLEENLEAFKLIRVTSEHQRTEVSVHPHAAHANLTGFHLACGVGAVSRRASV